MVATLFFLSMEQERSAIVSLKQGVHQLMNRCTELEIQKKEILSQFAAMEVLLISKNTEIDELNDKYKVLKMAKSLEGSSNENKDVKLKINEMVREIDKCIALLNK